MNFKERHTQFFCCCGGGGYPPPLLVVYPLKNNFLWVSFIKSIEIYLDWGFAKDEDKHDSQTSEKLFYGILVLSTLYIMSNRVFSTAKNIRNLDFLLKNFQNNSKVIEMKGKTVYKNV